MVLKTLNKKNRRDFYTTLEQKCQDERFSYSREKTNLQKTAERWCDDENDDE